MALQENPVLNDRGRFRRGRAGEALGKDPQLGFDLYFDIEDDFLAVHRHRATKLE